MPKSAVLALTLALVLYLSPQFAWAGAGVAAPGISNLASHRAVHRLSLARTSGSSGVTDLRGRLVMEWADVCTGYTLEQRMVMETQDASGAVSLSDFRFSTWESRDGLAFRFNLRHEIDGNTVDEVVGRASLDGPGQAGHVSFERPAEKDLELPAGTIFPSEHTAKVVTAAKAGAKRSVIEIFDGSGVEGFFKTVTVIGEQKSPESSQKLFKAVFGNKASWPMRLAFFGPESKDGLPEYEMTVRMYENGVVGDLILDYDNFSIKGELEKVERVSGGCS